MRGHEKQYLQYAKEYLIAKWSADTSIRYAGKGNRVVVEAFAQRFGCNLTAMEEGAL